MAAGTPQTVQGNSSITIDTAARADVDQSHGEVCNSAKSGFDISSGGTTGSSVFIFATEDGTISGWNRT